MDDLNGLRQRWAPEWYVWRSRDQDGEPNEWCATRPARGRELGMTLMEPTVEAFEAALERQPDGPLSYG